MADGAVVADPADGGPADPAGRAAVDERRASAFVQFSAAHDRAEAMAVGWTRDWDWRRHVAGGRLGGYWEASLGRWWTGASGAGSAWVGQLGLTPVLRWQPRDGDGRWFVEGGIGLHLLAPIYHRRDKRFSTALNFGDHLALGWQFGVERRDEVALRLQHFSNGGLRRPNPGENFVQLRYARRF